MSELTLTLMRLGFLAVLWLFVLTAISVIRSDLFGARMLPRRNGRGGAGQTSAGQQRQAPARPRRGVPTRLIVTGGSLAGTTVTLTGQQITLGRAHDSTIVLDDDYASSRHARIYPDQVGQWIVEDLGSTNGTYMDRTKLNGPTPLPLGMPVRIGKTTLELRK
jgi:pSer/pThr/pTyr-binding forkhead associated (FHA) protein